VGKSPLYSQLSRREAQIMDIVFELGEATATQIQERLPDPPSNSSVRVLLRILEEKGYLSHVRVDNRFVYQPRVAAEQAKQSALSHLVRTFFSGSVPNAVATLLSTHSLSPEELEEIKRLVDAAQKEDDND
jgi:predicted transcriptional regulator